VPGADRARFTEWTAVSTHLLRGVFLEGEERVRVEAAARELAAYFTGLIAERRGRHRDDLLSVLIRAEEEGDRLTPEELLIQSIGLLVAGFETTVGLIALGAKNLIDHPQELARLRARPALAASAVEECLRFESPVGMTTRVLHADAAFDGRTIPKDTPVWLSIWSANRDPARFPDPERFDVERRENEHLGFGGGTHLCLGAHLARMEAQEAFGALATRSKELTREPGRIAWGPSLFRVPARLAVEVKPA
jgi:cytochrome P450